jgi:hypothetical protein
MPLPSSDLADVVVGQTLRVRSDSLGQKMLFARITRVTDPGPDGYGTVAGLIQPCPDELMRIRTIKVDLIKERSDGTILPKECLTQQDGETGVYIIYKTMARFRKVSVKAMDQVNAVVDGVPSGTDVIKNPGFVREGLKVR